VRKETLKVREEAFVCMFCDHAGHLDEFCIRRKRIEKWRHNYARNSYPNEFTDFPYHSYSHAPPHSYSCASPHISSRAFSCFSHGPDHRSNDFGSRENSFVSRRFGYDPRPHRGDHTPRRHGFPIGESYTHFEPRHLDSPHFSRCGSRPTSSKGEVQKTITTSLGCMVKCWITKIYLTNPSTEPSTSSHLM
jgi:hypothetical protein